MDSFKLKLILSALGGMLFSLIFILLAFVLQPKKDQTVVKKRDANKLEKISQALREEMLD
jgi:hypothetical protein